ncbi:MAG TPA: hypothetical protein PLI95_04045 [Polyangiaceae bacterium]|mgnify:CR=1 FL=1|nr:hypothetical protein [Polyangiaceae bacterium]
MGAVFSLEHADPWSVDFIDVPSINAHASDAIASRIEEKPGQAHAGPDHLRSSSVLVLGPAGSGKTHLFARLRKRFGPAASFVLVRPEIGLSMAPRHMLAAIIDSLHRRCHGLETRQIEAVVGSLLSAVHQTDRRYPMLRIEELRNEADLRATLEEVIAALESRYDELDARYLEKLLLFPFASPVDRRALLAWLSGRELDDTQLKRLGLAGALADSEVIPALRTLAVAAAFGAPIVVAFDQLENLVDGDDGNDRIHAHARLVSELFDSVRGLVIVQMALDAEWHQRISPVLSQSERDRLEARKLALLLPGADEREALLAAWTDVIPSSERKGYFPWPFSEEGWLEWRGSPGVTPRMLMIACREAFEGKSELPPASPHGSLEHDTAEERLESQWALHVDRAKAELGDAAAQKRGIDRERIVAAILCSAHLAGIDASVPQGRKPGDVRLRHGAHETLVFVVQQPNARSAVASLNKAISAAAAENVVVLRERRIPFPATWKSVVQPLEELRTQSRASWFDLDDDHAAHLLALHDFLSAARSRDITDSRGRPFEESVVRDWAKKRAAAARWMIAPELVKPGDAKAPHRAVIPVVAAEVAAPTPNVLPSDGPAWRILQELRVASVERIVSEVRATQPEVSRAAVMRELRGAGQAIGWIGAAIVFVAGGTP